MNAPVEYLPPSVLSVVAPEFLLPGRVERILQQVAWEERTSARYEAFYANVNQPYTYGKGVGQRTYYPHAMPMWLEPLHDMVVKLAQKPMQLCFINRYDHQHQHLGWHADDSPEQDDDAPIIVQSFGAERELWFRPNGMGGPEHIEKQLLEHGSTLIMKPGMQQTHQHRIPKHPQPCGLRISLTWRSLKDAQ